MLVYLGLLLFIFIVTLGCNELIKNKKLRDKVITGICLTAIYLIYVLKDYSIGADTDAYLTAYEWMKNTPFNDYTSTYMEVGYQFLMKICILCKLDFRIFMMIAYAIAIVPLYFFIVKYSKNVSLSILTYICYQFFVFSMSGIRQTMALGFCVLAYMALELKGRWKYFWFLLIVFIGFLFHESTLVFIVVPFIKKIAVTKTNIIFLLITIAILFVFKDKISFFLSALTGTLEGFGLGANYILVLAIVLFSVLVYWLTNNINEIKHHDDSFDWFKMSIFALMLHTILYSSILLRAVTPLTLFFILLIPSLVDMFNEKSQKILNALISFGLVMFFLLTVIVPNQLDLVPYKFFWE